MPLALKVSQKNKRAAVYLIIFPYRYHIELHKLAKQGDRPGGIRLSGICSILDTALLIMVYKCEKRGREVKIVSSYKQTVFLENKAE